MGSLAVKSEMHKEQLHLQSNLLLQNKQTNKKRKKGKKLFKESSWSNKNTNQYEIPIPDRQVPESDLNKSGCTSRDQFRHYKAELCMPTK